MLVKPRRSGSHAFDGAAALGYNLSVGLMRSGPESRPRRRSQVTLMLWLGVGLVLVAWIAALLLR